MFFFLQLWVAEDGMKMQGYNGSQCWDTSFFIQAITEGGFSGEFPGCCQKIYSYLKRTQIPCDEDDRVYFFRQVSFVKALTYLIMLMCIICI